jgi:leader peptidase (prepilin peptidase)/N-methyltransferase
VAHPPSACPKCGHQIRNRHNIPVLGWLILRGRCYDCGAPISPRYPAVEAVTGVLFGLLTARLIQLDLGAAVPAYLVVAAAVVTVTMISVDRHRVPGLVALVGGALAAAGFVGASIATGQWMPLLRGAIAAAAVGAGALVVTGGHPWSRRDVVPYAALLIGALAYRSWTTGGVGLLACAAIAVALLGSHHRRWLVASLGPVALIVLVLPGLS